MSDDQLLSDTSVRTGQTEDAAGPINENTKLQSSVPPFPLFTPVNISEQIYRYQPTGLRITIKLPVVSDDKSPLFLIRVSPTIRTPAESLAYFNNGPSHYRNFFPLRHAPIVAAGLSYNRIADDASVLFTQHSPGPLISKIADAHRFWRGGLSFYLKTTSQFTNQAAVFLTKIPATPDLIFPLLGQTVPDGFAQAMSCEPTVPMSSVYLDTYQGNSFIDMDLSILRHAQVTVPYEKPFPRHDMYVEDYTHEMACTFDAEVGAVQVPSPNYSQWLAVGLKAGIDKGAGPNEVFMELYIKAEPDFEFSGYRGYPRLLNESQQQSFLSDYNMAIGKSPIIFPNSKVTNDATRFSIPATPTP